MFFLGCSSEPGDEAVFEPLPRPSLESLEPVVQEYLAERRAALDEVLADPEVPREDVVPLLGEVGRLYLTYGFHQAAAAVLQQADRRAPEEATWSYLEGVAWEELGHLESASQAYERVLERVARDLPSLLRQGRVALELGDRKKAERHFERALELDPSSATAYFGLGRLAVLEEDAESAVRFFSEALERQPSASAAHHALGLLWRDLGDLEKARQHLAQGGSLQPTFQDPRVEELEELHRGGRIHIVRGNRAQRAGQFREALAFYQKAVELDPQNPLAHHNLGAALGRAGDHRRALHHLQRSLELNPSSPHARFDLATALSRVGRLELAADQFSRALEIDPSDLEARFRRAMVWAHLGRRQEALGEFEELRRLAPGDPRSEQALAQLANSGP